MATKSKQAVPGNDLQGSHAVQEDEPAFVSDLDRVRTLPVVAADQIPSAPPGYATLTLSDSRRLRRMPENLRSEGIGALRELATGLTDRPGELGDLAPDPRLARALADRIDAADATIAALNALLAYHRQLQDAAEHDANRVMDEANAELTRRIRAGKVDAARYTKVASYTRAVGEAVALGLARARKERSSRGDRGAVDTKPDAAPTSP